MAKEIKSPPEGEQTGKQQHGVSIIGGAPIFMPGAPTQPGTFKIYRRMRGNPTIALARAAAMSPVRAAGWGLDSVDGTPDEWVAEIKAAIKPLWSQLIKNLLLSLDYGFAPFEKVFEISDGLVAYTKIKPLLVDITKIQVDKDTGEFAGFRQKSTVLDADKSLIFTYDGEAGNLYGRSRDENCRPEWSKWIDAANKSSQYTTKAAGVIPMIEYPEGKSNDPTGNEIDNWKHAAKMLAELGKGHGVYMPKVLASWAGDVMRQGIDVTQLMAWSISFLETKGQHGKEIVELMRHWESLMMRGWLVPERTAVEGQHGTKAESETHATLSLGISYLLLLDMVDVINADVINPLLRFNHGAEAADSVFVVPEELGSDEQVFFRELLKQVFAHPQNLDLFLNVLNVDTLLDVAGLPKTDGFDIERAAEDAAQRATASDLPPSAESALLGIYSGVARRAGN